MREAAANRAWRAAVMVAHNLVSMLAVVALAATASPSRSVVQVGEDERARVHVLDARLGISGRSRCNAGVRFNEHVNPTSRRRSSSKMATLPKPLSFRARTGPCMAGSAVNACRSTF
jgi:hypothetical protein